MKKVCLKDLKELAKKRDQQAIIAYCVERDGTVRCVTHGENKLKCKAAGWWGQGNFKNDTFITRLPFENIFGWGNYGKPLPLSESEKDSLRNKEVPKELIR